MNNKRVIINVDDVGLHPAVDDAIVQLAARNVVSSGSVMVLCSATRSHLRELAGVGVDCGLHLDFTSAQANASLSTSHTVRSLIAAAWGRRLDRRALAAAIHRQLDRFEELADAAPRFVDGHEHVHQFPIIRDELLRALRARYPSQPPFVRSTRPKTWQGVKAAIVAALGARATGRLARASALRTNADFAGIYDFDPVTDLAQRWERWLASMPEQGGLLMCHPARAPIPGDPIARARVAEFEFLCSERWQELAQRHRIELAGWERACGMPAA